MRPQSWLPLGEIRVDLVSGWIVDSQDQKTQLTTKEVDLLRALVGCPGAWIERERLYELVWGYSPKVVSRSLDTTLFRLRAKLGTRGALILQTARSQGVAYLPLGAPQESGVSLVSLGWEYGWESLSVNARLLSILGPAGPRRTQLGWEYLQWRCQKLDTRWLSLAGLEDGVAIEEQIAAVLGDPQPCVSGAMARCFESLEEGDSVLLILDDIDAGHGFVASRLSEWLSEVPQLQVVVTADRALEIGGEHHLVQASVLDPAQGDCAGSLLEWARRLGEPFSLGDAEVEFGVDAQPPVSEQVLSLLDSGDLRVVATEHGGRMFCVSGERGS
ncbi:MAG: helix-turn-helix domain-containing protein [Myxococcota bacterium]|nr:helix-turn-helix domain-containing protein [Myxococcota bacterium]